ncbi:MAG: SH3 domain-containing protein, partial [Oceanococcaceae bacterium]
MLADTGEAKIRINMREAPDLSTGVVGTLNPSDKVEILGYEGDYAMVRTADGSVGYLKTKYLDITKDVVAAAPA